ncbi:MAG TPA: tail fiber domain-containing protein [Chloroflexota bacterium]
MLHLMALQASLRARLENREEGQGMVEYGLIIAAVAIAVIVAVFALGPKIATMFNTAGASLSDRNKKANFAAVNAREVLGRVVSLPIETWNYLSQGPAIRHIGPMAQDFHTAFGVGEDDTHINMVDANGVALAAIQGLYQVVQEQEMQLTVLEARLAALEARERELTLA